MTRAQNDKYLATQLPHEFESRDQYEGTLRLPVGADWVTKETFQTGTKPRVIIKQGIIAPMSRPVI
jgi:U3 small nucleolar RNA-associated protein 14